MTLTIEYRGDKIIHVCICISKNKFVFHNTNPLFSVLVHLRFKTQIWLSKHKSALFSTCTFAFPNANLAFKKQIQYLYICVSKRKFVFQNTNIYSDICFYNHKFVFIKTNMLFAFVFNIQICFSKSKFVIYICVLKHKFAFYKTNLLKTQICFLN